MELEKLELERQEIKKKMDKFNAIGAILIGIGLIITVVINIVGILFVFVGIFLIGNAFSTKTRFSSIYKGKIVNAIIKEELGESAVYMPKEMISIQEINECRLLQKPDRYRGEDYIKATYDDVVFEMCDLILEEEVVTTDSNGNVTRSYEQYFKGRFFIFDFNKDMNKTLYVMPGMGRPRGVKLTKFETESIEFNKKFNTYADSNEDGFYLLTPKMIESMLELQKLYKGRQYYCFLNGKFYVAINNHSDSLEVNVNKPIDEKSLKYTRSDLKIAPAIINEFGLNKSKFTIEKMEEVKKDDDEINI